jgi:phospholipid/cholesterol/gamma-HCH transport system substrate-binding protein
MSKSGSKPLAVGLVALIGIGTVAIGVFLVGGEQRIWEGRTRYQTQFSRTNGLQEGAPVALNGVTVGSVLKMRFPSDPAERHINVEIAVVSVVAPRIRRDTVARIQTLGLLGDKYVALNSGSLDEDPMEEGSLLRSIDPVDYEALLGQSGDVVTNAIEVTALLKQMLIDMNKTESVLGRLVSDQSLGRDLNRVVGNVKDASGEAAQLMARLNEQQLATNLSRSMENIADVSGRIRSGQGTIGRLVYDESLYEDADALLSGGRPGAFWRLLWKGAAFFWPFSSNDDHVEKGTEAAPPLP